MMKNYIHIKCIFQASRPTPPHLTSIQAEQILATACENEAQNAKRMRLGLEPVSQPNPLVPQVSLFTFYTIVLNLYF